MYCLLFCLTDTSYDRAVEDDRRGSVPSVTLTRPNFSFSPGDDASTTASAAQSDKNSIASTSDSKVSVNMWWPLRTTTTEILKVLKLFLVGVSGATYEG